LQMASEGEVELAQHVVDCVVKLLVEMKQMPLMSRTPEVELPEYLVGAAASSLRIIDALRERGLVLLHGMGGSGKTTLAKSVYKKLREDNPCMPCHFASLGPGLVAANDVMEEQCKMFKALFDWTPKPTPFSAEDGRGKLGKKLKSEHATQAPVLLVVDNVWATQLRWLLPMDIMELLAPGSMVLVTSRNAGVAEGFILRDEVLGRELGDRAMEMGKLSRDDASKLFCQYAFGAATVPKGKELIVEEVVEWCDGLPMAVEVYGRYIKVFPGEELGAIRDAAPTNQVAGRSESEDDTLFATLRLSWDKLTEKQQHALLDIAYFLRGKPWHLVEAYCTVPVLTDLVRLGMIKVARPSKMEHLDAALVKTAVMHDMVFQFCTRADKLQQELRTVLPQSDEEEEEGEEASRQNPVGSEVLLHASGWC
jgi:hypothetical protein